MESALAREQPKDLGSIRNYVLLDEIGRGAHGTVYRACLRDRPNDVVALKVIDDNSSIDRLLVEPQLLSKLHHPNIVKLRDYFLHAGKVVLVMEYIDGPDLGAYANARGKFPGDDVRECLRQLAAAVAHAHEAGIFHSDLKPKNILVDASGPIPRYVVVDFGVSRIARGVQLTRYVAGTCSFMAPEQLRGRGCMQSDLWALGAMAYLLLAGVLPFPASTMEELRKQILYSQPSFAPTIVRADSELERIVVRLLEKSIVDRTASATTLLGELSTDAPYPSISPERRDVAVMTSWELGLLRDVKWRKKRIIGWALVASLPDIVPGLLGCYGVWLIYRGQVQRRGADTAFGFGLIALAMFVAGMIGLVFDAAFGDGAGEVLSGIGLLFGFFALPAAAHFVKLRRAQRELTLLRSIETSDVAQSLAVLKQYVDATPGDTNIRRRYVEALLAAGKTAEAAVEARLILDEDAYNLPATLLLAHAYLELGLLERCEQVCNGYLEVAGQCFEFEELREVVTRRREAA